MRCAAVAHGNSAFIVERLSNVSIWDFVIAGWESKK